MWAITVRPTRAPHDDRTNDRRRPPIQSHHNGMVETETTIILRRRCHPIATLVPSFDASSRVRPPRLRASLPTLMQGSRRTTDLPWSCLKDPLYLAQMIRRLLIEEWYVSVDISTAVVETVEQSAWSTLLAQNRFTSTCIPLIAYILVVFYVSTSPSFAPVNRCSATLCGAGRGRQTTSLSFDESRTKTRDEHLEDHDGGHPCLGNTSSSTRYPWTPRVHQAYEMTIPYDITAVVAISWGNIGSSGRSERSPPRMVCS
jgi:hypothetical protein